MAWKAGKGKGCSSGSVSVSSPLAPPLWESLEHPRRLLAFEFHFPTPGSGSLAATFTHLLPPVGISWSGLEFSNVNDQVLWKGDMSPPSNFSSPTHDVSSLFLPVLYFRLKRIFTCITSSCFELKYKHYFFLKCGPILLEMLRCD